ncbi:MAG TPA: malto-oligosyltrehalose trehalohydrolase, partial [Actinomycetota bacterium]|nr:malto-oligosyltrehalose trehalohydrolase [Actinomycetota bacterium]
MTQTDRLGATHLGGGRTRYAVWAPGARRLEVVLDGRREALERGEGGLFAGEIDRSGPGTRYRLSLDGADPLPDPASRHQPEGVDGPSAVVDLGGFPWTDRAWRGLPLDRLAIYELHVGTFTSDGTFDGVIDRLDDLVDLGITAVEVMPVAQFPGERNWGYDGVFPFAAQDSYGGVEGLARLVDAAHDRGMAVILDVVYNHLGPEGNVLPDFGPYFTDRYVTPWGGALNFDGPGSGGVRRFFIENALWWLLDLHVDALRLDAIQGIVDTTARPFLAELSEAVDEAAARTGRSLHLIAETDRIDPGIVAPRDRHGLGIHAMWADDLHHALHALLTGERGGYYADFGRREQLAGALRDGSWVSGPYSRPRAGRRAPIDAVPPVRLVVYAQNHDQVGNRPRGRRLGRLLDEEQRKLASGLVLLSPFIPLLFMGEEYGEPSPFHYFVSHSDPELVESVRRGRLEELSHFAWPEEPPDPQDERTFLSSKLRWDLRTEGEHAALLALHRELLRLRRSEPALAARDGSHEVDLDGPILTL